MWNGSDLLVWLGYKSCVWSPLIPNKVTPCYWTFICISAINKNTLLKITLTRHMQLLFIFGHLDKDKFFNMQIVQTNL